MFRFTYELNFNSFYIYHLQLPHTTSSETTITQRNNNETRKRRKRIKKINRVYHVGGWFFGGK